MSKFKSFSQILFFEILKLVKIRNAGGCAAPINLLSLKKNETLSL